MDIQQVLSRFSLIANLKTEEAQPWLPICNEAIDYVLEHLKPHVNEEKDSRRLITAAAALAFYRYSLYRASGSGMDSFSAGDIRITENKKETVQSAFAVWCEAKGAISDLLLDDQFLFEKVKAR